MNVQFIWGNHIPRWSCLICCVFPFIHSTWLFSFNSAARGLSSIMTTLNSDETVAKPRLLNGWSDCWKGLESNPFIPHTHVLEIDSWESGLVSNNKNNSDIDRNTLEVKKVKQRCEGDGRWSMKKHKFVM